MELGIGIPHLKIALRIETHKKHWWKQDFVEVDVCFGKYIGMISKTD